MPTYQLQIKQIVDYPRCRIYRQFVRFLMEDRSIRVSGGSGLFYFTVLCSYANFRTSYRRIDGISYTVYPGEWVCTLKELSQWFRTRFQCQALAVLERLQKQGESVVFCGDGALLGRQKIAAASDLFRIAPPTMVIPRAGSLALAGQLGIPQTEVLAVGDSENDRKMLEAAGVAAVMANGMPSIQSLADIVSQRDCNHDGVAELFERLGLTGR